VASVLRNFPEQAEYGLRWKINRGQKVGLEGNCHPESGKCYAIAAIAYHRLSASVICRISTSQPSWEF